MIPIDTGTKLPYVGFVQKRVQSMAAAGKVII